MYRFLPVRTITLFSAVVSSDDRTGKSKHAGMGNVDGALGRGGAFRRDRRAALGRAGIFPPNRPAGFRLAGVAGRHQRRLRNRRRGWTPGSSTAPRRRHRVDRPADRGFSGQYLYGALSRRGTRFPRGSVGALASPAIAAAVHCVGLVRRVAGRPISAIPSVKTCRTARS